MAAYLVADTTIVDPAKFQSYRVLVQTALAKYGGRYLVRGAEADVLEGGRVPAKTAIIEFASAEQARVFYDSPEYQAARAAREGAAKVDMVLVEGT